MSLEESMKDLADANRELAAGLREYAGVIKKVGLKALGKADSEEEEEEGAPKPKASKSTATKSTAAKSATKKSAPKEEEEEEEEDPFGENEEEEEEEEVTLDDVKAALIALRDKTGDKEAPLAVMGKFGYKKVPDIQSKDFAKVKAAAEAALKKAK